MTKDDWKALVPATCPDCGGIKYYFGQGRVDLMTYAKKVDCLTCTIQEESDG